MSVVAGSLRKIGHNVWLIRWITFVMAGFWASVAGVLYVYFFFSSRRRQTRLTCDWSSDVCSSDLTAARPRHRHAPGADEPRGGDRRRGRRSEERRVGKEWRCRWTWWHKKKKDK